MTSDRSQILALANDLASWWGKARVLEALKVWGPSGSLGALRAAVARETAVDELCERLAQSPRFGGGRATLFMDTARALSVPVEDLARLVEGELAQDARPNAFAGSEDARQWAPCAPISLWSWALGPWQEVEVYASKRTKPAYVVSVVCGKARKCTCEDFAARSQARRAAGLPVACKHFAVAEAGALFWATVWALVAQGVEPCAVVASYNALGGATEADKMARFTQDAEQTLEGQP